MTSRLAHLDRDSDELLRASEPRIRFAAAVAASELALRVCNVSVPLEATGAIERHAYAAALDRIYFDLHDVGHEGAEVAFAAARASTSSACASEGAAGEAVYEAVIATENLQLVKVTVLAAIRDAVA